MAGMKKHGRKSRKIGLPPGTLVHVGEMRTEEPQITMIDYDEARLQEKAVERVEEVFPFRDTPTVTWINVAGLHRVDVVEKLGKHFGLHPLVMEDIVNAEQRPKMEDFGSYIFIVCRVPHHDGVEDGIELEQISIVLGAGFVLTFLEAERGLFDPVRERLRSAGSRVRRSGSDFLAYALLDVMVDSYFRVMEILEEEIEEAEDALVAGPSTETLSAIHKLKRKLALLGKAVWPAREVVMNLERGESPLIKDSTRIYLRDVYDHMLRIIEGMESYRESITGMLDIYLSSVSNRMNEIMMFLTVIGTIFIPLTFITGIYGMNFRYMPELAWRWGYPAVLAVMLGIGVAMLAYFRKRRWI